MLTPMACCSLLLAVVGVIAVVGAVVATVVAVVVAVAAVVAAAVAVADDNNSDLTVVVGVGAFLVSASTKKAFLFHNSQHQHQPTFSCTNYFRCFAVSC